MFDKLGTICSDVVRKWGDTAVETSIDIAGWEVGNGLSYANMALATDAAYQDALAGAALCGSSGSVLMLVNAGEKSKVAGVASANKEAMSASSVFGGIYAVPDAIVDTLKEATQVKSTVPAKTKTETYHAAVTKKVVDKPAWDEQVKVVDKEARDELTPIYFVASSDGALFNVPHEHKGAVKFRGAYT